MLRGASAYSEPTSKIILLHYWFIRAESRSSSGKATPGAAAEPIAKVTVAARCEAGII